MSKIIMLVLVTSCSTLDILNNNPTFECSNRFEFRHILHDYMKELNNCTFVREKYPICGGNIIVAVSIEPPYTMSFKKGSITGILPGMLDIAMDACCHGCTNVSYISVEDNVEKYFNAKANVIMPHQGALKSSQFLGFDYIPFFEVKGVTFLTKRSNKKKLYISNSFLSSILGTWPLFVTAFLMAFIAGCIVWVLDSWLNIDEFPTSFPRGPFEGFWWAFVSMTTVGYGDKAPKSIAARIFAVIWILAGITIFSMYTATLTSALTTKIELNKVDTILGKKVGVLSATAAGHSATIRENGDIVFYDDVHKLIDALDENSVYAIALDDNLASFHLSELEHQVQDLAQLHRLSTSGNSYGILSNNKNFTNFIKSFLQSNEDNRDAMLSYVKNIQKIKTYLPKEDDSRPYELFSGKSTVFYQSLGILVALGVFTVLIGLTCKLAFKRNKSWLDIYVKSQQFKTEKKNDKELPMQNDKAVSKNEFIQELEAFKEKMITMFDNERK